MAWQQITFSTDADTAEKLNEWLLETEALAVTLQDAEDEPIFEPALGTTPLWGKTELVALFSEDLDLQILLKDLEQGFGPLPAYQIQRIAEQNWERVWMDEFKPMQFGERLWIYPSWCEPIAQDAVNLLLDPGLAFGTGTHPTTRLCLEWLDQNPPLGQTLIDYGCGSGILALAAIKLGAKLGYAVDNDPQALLATAENASRNHIDTEQLATHLPEQLPKLKADVLIANILAQPLQMLASQFAELVKPSGVIVLSGILTEQADGVIEAYKPWFNLYEKTQSAEWVRLVGIRNEVVRV